MTPSQIIQVIAVYEHRLVDARVPKIRLDPKRTFRSTTIAERLSHAHYLCAGVKKYALDAEQQRKAGSHLAAVQMCLSFAGWYTLEELMEHNRSKQLLRPDLPPEGWLHCVVMVLGLSVRSSNCLQAGNVLYLRDLVLKTEADLIQMGLIRKDIRHIKQGLAIRGLALAG